jgi:hypothetical protein
MKNLTDITIVLDRSGSMASIANATINGFNSFLSEQKEVKGEALLTLVQFDHEFELLFEGQEINKVVPLSSETFIPRGMTALLDAIGKTINLTKERIRSQKHPEHPPKVIFVIITDGYENNSNIYDRSRIFEMITKRKKKNDWQFVFLGANQDAIHEAQFIGIPKEKAMTFASDFKGAEDCFSSISFCLSKIREKGIEFEFTDKQRKEQERNKTDNN